jgi:hypothetical protein
MGCRGQVLGISITKWMPEVRPVYGESLEELEKMLLGDILNHIDCHLWTEMRWPVLNCQVGVFVLEKHKFLLHQDGCDTSFL